jgi:hypothetical protein
VGWGARASDRGTKWACDSVTKGGPPLIFKVRAYVGKRKGPTAEGCTAAVCLKLSQCLCLRLDLSVSAWASLYTFEIWDVGKLLGGGGGPICCADRTLV